MNKYKVLWFDDKHEIYEMLKEEALEYDIVMKGVDNATNGILELNEHYLEYSAVILDGLFFKSPNQNEDAVDDEAFGLVAKSLLEFKNKGIVIPWFIYSGQPSFIKEKNTLVKVLADKDFANGRIFDKNKDEDLIALCNEIKKASENVDYIRIKNAYTDVFEICSSKYLGEAATLPLLSAIKLSEKNQFNETKDAFNGLRKIVELLFGKLNKIGLIPDEIVNNGGWVNKSSLFLAGKHNDYTLDDEIIHPAVSFMLHGILQIVQDASHSYPDNLRLKVDDFISINRTPYLYRSTLNQLLDVLVYFKKHMNNYPNVEHNNKFWQKISHESNAAEGVWLKGKVVRIADNGYGTFEPGDGGEIISIVPNKVSQYALIEKQQIEIRTEPSPDGTKKHIKEIKI